MIRGGWDDDHGAPGPGSSASQRHQVGSMGQSDSLLGLNFTLRAVDVKMPGFAKVRGGKLCKEQRSNAQCCAEDGGGCEDGVIGRGISSVVVLQK